jgi:hypothetical protein
MTKIGRKLQICAVFASLFFSLHAARAEVQASVDRSEITQDESISLKISTSGGDEKTPKFEAPDFEIMNQFESSQYSSVYVNGKFENKSEHFTTFILRPLKFGNLKIKNITAGSEHAADVSIQVSRDTGMNKRNLPGEAPSLKGDAKNFFVKADVSKTRAYKGEQIIVSFYLYRRTRTNMRDVMQYPSFSGFIREDLEMPILSGHQDYEAVSLGGIPFERALLARYAVYPIQEGKLKIDGFSIRADYIPKNSGNDDLMEDPFFQFFSQVTPRTGTAKSDPVTIEVLPVPEEGKTALFSGGVGDFEVKSEIDSTPLKANAPLTLRVSVKGKGNTSLVEFPKVDWPKELKFFESQGKSKNLGQGVTEKTFEVVLVPLQKGNYEIPPVEFEFFNPDSRSYVRKKTNAIPIQVAEGDPNSAPMLPEKSTEPSTLGAASAEPTAWGNLRTKDEAKADSPSAFYGQPWWRWVAWFGLLVFFCFVGMVIFDETKKRSKTQLDLLKRKQSSEAFWQKLQREAQSLTLEKARIAQFSPIYEQIIDQIYKTLDDAFGMTSRAHSQRELAKLLTENHGVTPEQWSKISQILEFSETIRFASSTGVVSDIEVQEKTQSSIETAKKLCAEITAKK